MKEIVKFYSNQKTLPLLKYKFIYSIVLKVN